jgi:DNA-directed RNA polymerase specialized sigma24 family protein
MRDPDQDNPTEAESRCHIKKRYYEGIFEKFLQEWEGEIKRRCANELFLYMDDPITEAEELTQVIFTEFYRKLPTHYDPSISQVRTYLHTITTGRILDRRRHARRSRTNYYNHVTYEMKRRELHSPGPEKVVLDQEKVGKKDSC